MYRNLQFKSELLILERQLLIPILIPTALMMLAGVGRMMDLQYGRVFLVPLPLHKIVEPSKLRKKLIIGNKINWKK
jgi:hypothetical protein